MLGVIVKTIMIQAEGRSNPFSSESELIVPIEVPIEARRGQILDDKANPLVTSVSFYEIRMDATVVKQEIFDKDIDSLALMLSKLYPEQTFREYSEQIRRARSTKNRFLMIRKKATNEERKLLRTFPIFREGRNKGGLIDNIETIVRKRPYGILAHRTLGYVKEDIRVGLEAAYDDILAGEEGIALKQKMKTGLKPTGVLLRETVDGSDIVTTIDKDIQEVAETELMNQLKAEEARHGSVIVMEVKTGRIKAIANLQRTENGEYFETFNFAVGLKSYPGSTMKLASLMAAIEDGKIGIEDTVNATGIFQFYNVFLHDTDNRAYGKITIKRAFELSSNVIAKVIQKAYGENPQAFVDRLKSFGLHEPLGLEINGEPDPTMYQPGDASWSKISLPWMSIGYEVQLTPLQTLAFYNAVANNGTVMKPQFVTQIRRNGVIEKEFEPIVLRKNICSQRTIDLLRSCLEGVVENGTGRSLKSASFSIAGKTGTSRLDAGPDKAEGMKHQASFVGYFPADDPIYSCIVVIAAPSNNIYGSKVSGTVFTAIANKVYSTHLKYQKGINEQNLLAYTMPASMDGNRYDLDIILNRLSIKKKLSTSSPWISTYARDSHIEMTERTLVKGLVPNVVGMGLKDALYLLGNEGFTVEVSGKGRVVHQSLMPGTTIESTSLIKLELK
jgi:cell division protein FtsI (penicillin-binding protein 3)